MDEMDPSISGEDGGTAPDPPLPPPVPGAFRSKKLEFVKSIDAVFKLEVTHCEPWYVRPWTKLRQTRSHSTGFAIDTEKRYILTNAHCVDNSVVVQVRKRNVSKSFPAQVLCIGLECDLALLTVPSDEFWSGVHAIKLEDELVEMGDVVDTVGFPKGGEKLCVTNGVVSRVDLSGYYLAIQIDAAINSGNSGGPVLNDKQACVGVAYKKLADAKTDNISYIIPIEVVRHFLTDYAKHGRYTGVAELCFIWQPLENDGLRRSLGMQEGQSGIRVTSVLPWSQAKDVLQVGDLILKIDGQKIENVGKVPFHDGEFISLDYLISCKFPGDVCVVELLRGTELLTVSYELPAISPLVPRKPATLDYFIVGGLVFLPLSQALAASTKRKLLGVCAASMTTVVLNVKARLDEEIVVLGDVLRHQLNVGFTWRAYSRVISFNGVAIINLRHLITLVQSCDTEWMRFELDDLGQQLILLNSKDVAAAQDDILSSNNIPGAFRPPDADSA